MNSTKFRLGAIMIVLVSTIIGIGLTPILLQQSSGKCPCPHPGGPKAPITTSGDNVYIAWWTNKTGDWEVMFKASADAGNNTLTPSAVFLPVDVLIIIETWFTF